MEMKLYRILRSVAIVLFVLCGAALMGGVENPAVPASADSPQQVRMAVLMYHSVNSNECRVGDYVITPWALRRDLEYLKEQGYQTIVMSELIDYVHNGTPLPEKPVMLTFDDGYYNNYKNAFPLLQEYGAKAVISIIGTETDKYSKLEENNQNYSHLTWDQIKEMQASGLVEFQNHGYDMHKSGKGGRLGSTRKSGESEEEYQVTLAADILRLQQRYTEMTGWTPNTYTYPFGRISKESYPVVTRLGFAASLDVQGRPYLPKVGDERCLFRIPRYNRTSGTSAQAILQEAMASKSP